MKSKLFSLLGSAISFLRLRKDNSATEGFEPYSDRACNRLYNALFCDKLVGLRRDAGERPTGNWGILLAETPYADALRPIANDANEESRARIVAFARLRELKEIVPERILLGVIVELGMPEGLDVLAAYPDGRVHYIHHKEKVSTFDPAPSGWIPNVKRLLSAAQEAVECIGPWEGLRLAPPTAGMIRMSFLVSDGLYFGQGPLVVMDKDELAGPIIAASGALLKLIDAADPKGDKKS
jgi:hypothetical protein